MGLWKRAQRVGHLQPAEMLHALSQLQLRGLLHSDAVWLAAPPPLVWLLDICCVGESSSGGGDAMAAASVVAAVGKSGVPANLEAYYSEQQARQQEFEQEWLRRRGAQHQHQQHHHQQQHRQQQSTGSEQPVQGEAHQAALTAVRLSPAEAFFLKYTLGCLEAWKPATPPPAAAGPPPPPAAAAAPPAGLAPLNETALWQWCCAASARVAAADCLIIDRAAAGAATAAAGSEAAVQFPALYATYHHCRSKGWLPRPGRNYGCHYLLYSHHPDLVHSQFCVVVVPQQQQQQQRGPPVGLGGMQLAWTDVHGMQRLAGRVQKQLLLLHVALPLEAERLGEPGCLDAAAVEEVLVNRYVPSLER